jgi:cellulose synthase/poly-beta-1,6-N-acetylglucosamine synthase-like glycosyltransferase
MFSNSSARSLIEEAWIKRLRELPRVTVQLPLYNELYVVTRLLNAVSRFDYPRGLLEIQVLDDSTDETGEIARNQVRRLREGGLAISYHHRSRRDGFKAGALAEGMKTARGELFAVFDADFVPWPDFLAQTVPFFSDPRVGMVQTRWEHLNRDSSLLTRGQAILLDGHFQIEHTARHRAGRFFNFNGTAGIWRREAIVSAGGWQADTLTEDMDLSYRAQLQGWKFIFLPEITAPAELPMEMNAFKAQQFRWAKGAVQTGKKLLPRIWRSPFPLRIKLEATFHLTNAYAHLFIALFTLMLFPVFMIRGITDLGLGTWQVVLIDFPLFILATASASAFYVASQRELYPDWKRVFHFLPFLTALGVGMSLSNAKAVLEGLFGGRGVFERTAKHGSMVEGGAWKRSKYRGKAGTVVWLEFLFSLYFVVMIGLALAHRSYASLPFLVTFLAGFLYVAVNSAFTLRRPVSLPARETP